MWAQEGASRSTSKERRRRGEEQESEREKKKKSMRKGEKPRVADICVLSSDHDELSRLTPGLAPGLYEY